MLIPDVMCGVQLVGHGGSDKLVWNETIPTPKPGPGAVLVRILGAGVNNTDINTRIGWYAKQVTGATDSVADDGAIEEGGWSGALSFPLIQGGDLCGEVVALGDGVSDPALGRRVTCAINQPCPSEQEPVKFKALGSELDGAFAQYCCVPANQLFDVSRSPLTDVEIAAIPCAHGTAYNLISRAGVSAGDRVLVTGASGGVGRAAVELAKIKGAVVTGLAGAAKQGAVTDAGADYVIDRDTRPEPRSFDVVIDVVGGQAWPTFIESLVPGGRYATSGAIAGPMVEADLRIIYLSDLTIYGCTFQPRGVFAELVDLINDGRVRPLISKTYPLADIHRAQEDFQTKRYAGKLVLIPPGV
ncbi:MAG: alcohol dehydrogenase family protein [Rhodospirillales bacterium]